MSEVSCCFLLSHFRLFRHSYFIISVPFPDYCSVLFPEISVLHISSFPFHFRMIPSSYFRKFPSFIFHHFRFISGLFRRLISGNFRHSYFIISVSFPGDSGVLFPEISVLHISSFPLHFRMIPSLYFRKFPSFIFHHFHFISGFFRRLISGNFRHSYFILSVSFPDYSVFLFPEISVIHISSFPFHFRIIPSSYFRKFPSFIFHHFRFISGLFRFGRPRHF